MNLPEPTPLHCRQEAFEALADHLDDLDTTRGLLRCAVAVSMHQLAGVKVGAVEAEIDAIAGSIMDRVNSGQPRALLAHAHAVLFDEARFTGNTRDYYSPDNSYLSRILTTRQGLPITLVLLYKCVLETVGLRVLGINAPGHFLAGVAEALPTADLAESPDTDSRNNDDLGRHFRHANDSESGDAEHSEGKTNPADKSHCEKGSGADSRAGSGAGDDSGEDSGESSRGSSGGSSGGGGGGGMVQLLIDPFHSGKMLSREEAFARIEEIAGGSVIRDDALLRPATHTQWLIRIVQNLVSAFDRLGQPDDVAAMLEMRALIESVK